MIISRQVKANWGARILPYRTNGIYGHLPKFYHCKGPHWYPTYNSVVEKHLNPDQELVFEYNDHPAHWYPHLSLVGYLCLVLPIGTLHFYYMGNPYRHKIFEWHKKARCWRCNKYADQYFDVQSGSGADWRSFGFNACMKHCGTTSMDVSKSATSADVLAMIRRED